MGPTANPIVTDVVRTRDARGSLFFCFGAGRGILENIRGRSAPGQSFPPGVVAGRPGAGRASLTVMMMMIEKMAVVIYF